MATLPVPEPGTIVRTSVEVVLVRLYPDQEIIVNCGRDLAAQAQRVFSVHADADFLKALDPGPRKVEVWELRRDATFKEMAESLRCPPVELRLTPEEIVAFCRDHRDKLSKPGATLFLYEEGGELFVADVCVDGRRLGLDRNRFDYVDVWRAGVQHRLVAPQRDSSETPTP